MEEVARIVLALETQVVAEEVMHDCESPHVTAKPCGFVPTGTGSFTRADVTSFTVPSGETCRR